MLHPACVQNNPLRLLPAALTRPSLKHPYPTSTVTLRHDGVSLTATNLPDNVKRSNIAVKANDKSCLN